MDSLLSTVVVCLTAILIDQWLGEPRRWHPLIAYGRQVERVERWLNTPPGQNVARGAWGVAMLVGAPVAAALLLIWILPPALEMVAEVLGLWLALSLRGLAEHARAVEYPLRAGHLVTARLQVSRMVSRQTESLDDTGVATAATESVLENGADAVFASLFWFLVAGLPGVVLHRTVNTLDAMWGYRNPRYLSFGRAAARLDDVLNWVPARLTAMTYALVGHSSPALRCWHTQAAAWDSPNAGPVMAAGAGALKVTLGGLATYSTGVKTRPLLGEGPAPNAFTIDRAIALVRRGVWLWMILLGVLALMTMTPTVIHSGVS
ncbi:adenosylcobinamide-phosphate synthase CbiB [Marinobacter caseinilyticus]|uniref:adenosylcobinamide-phosphate synthase CbiB n=1 Tax=Marinobacter caseinilyticus TaxID=2692195 RepID=UPI00140A22B0|nr:adenosylcobinamide-phosphate synthase CbiB [Marinobacter caseinilyticus]